MASPTRWTWVWVNSRSWWWTGRPGVLWFMGLQRVGHDWATELNWTDWVLTMYLVFSLNSPLNFYNGLAVRCHYDAYVTVKEKKNRKWLPEGQVTHWWQSQESNPGSLAPQTLPSFQGGMFWGQSLTFGVDALLIQTFLHKHLSQHASFLQVVNYLSHFGSVYSLVLCYCGLWFRAEVSTCKEVRRWIQNQKQFSWINKVLCIAQRTTYSVLWIYSSYSVSYDKS